MNLGQNLVVVSSLIAIGVVLGGGKPVRAESWEEVFPVGCNRLAQSVSFGENQTIEVKTACSNFEVKKVFVSISPSLQERVSSGSVSFIYETGQQEFNFEKGKNYSIQVVVKTPLRVRIFLFNGEG